MLKPFILIAGCLALLSMCSPKADAVVAAGPTQDSYGCGSTVTWNVETTPEITEGTASAAVRWAFQQVAGPADITAKQDVGGVVVWQWHQALSGTSQKPGEAYILNRLAGDDAWVHVLDGDRKWGLREAKGAVLKTILTDLGVRHPTSTAAGLSKVDRVALRQACKNAPAHDEETDNQGKQSEPLPRAPKAAAVLLGLTLTPIVLISLAIILAEERTARAWSAVKTRIGDVAKNRRGGRQASDEDAD